MANTVLQQVAVRAMNVDALNCDAIYTDGSLSNGSVFTRGAISATAGNGELFTVVVPTTTTLSNLWMACSPEVVIITSASSNKYTGLSVDPRDFTNIAGTPIAAFKPEVGDLIKITADGITGGALSGLTVNQFAVAADGVFTLSPSASAISGLTFKVRSITDSITIADYKCGTSKVAAALLECVAVA